jgi:fluoroquinolone transport system permease protein
MRMKALLLGDIRFQIKYGIYFIYVIFTILYVSLLYILPQNWRERAAVLMIFSDPAAMGLYFMGAVILFEKSEKVLSSIAISPVRVKEYVLSKLISVGLASTAVGLLIGLGGKVIENPFFFSFGLFAGSLLFSSVGLSIAVKVESLNQFIVATIPAEILINIPAVAYLFGWEPRWILLHPGACIMEILQNGGQLPLAAVILAVWTTAASILTVFMMKKSIQSLGGVKL